MRLHTTFLSYRCVNILLSASRAIIVVPSYPYCPNDIAQPAVYSSSVLFALTLVHMMLVCTYCVYTVCVAASQCQHEQALLSLSKSAVVDVTDSILQLLLVARHRPVVTRHQCNILVSHELRADIMKSCDKRSSSSSSRRVQRVSTVHSVQMSISFYCFHMNTCACNALTTKQLIVHCAVPTQVD
jgi:hypothetical protein